MISTFPRSSKVTIGSIALIGVMLLFYAEIVPADDKPEVRWIPPTVKEVIEPGQTRIIPITFRADKNLPGMTLRVSPEIAFYVAVNPAAIEKTRKGTMVPLALTVRIPLDALPTTVTGVVEPVKTHQRSSEDERGDDDNGGRGSNEEREEKKVGKPLPVTLDVVWPETHYGSVSLSYPPGLVIVQRDNAITFGPISDDGLPALFSITKIALTDNLAQLPTRDALSIIVNRGLEPEDIISTTYHDGGAEVAAQTFTRHHFFVYDPDTNTALEFLSSDNDFFTSSKFLEILKTLKF